MPDIKKLFGKQKADDLTREEIKQYVLLKIFELQKDTAPVKLQIGYCDKKNFVYHEEIIIKEGPPAIINGLQNDAVLKGYIHFDVTELNGVHIELF